MTSQPSTAQADSSVVATSDLPQLQTVNRFSRKKDEGLWLMSFSDMSMILISFFILQLSFSTMNAQKADILRAAIQPTQFDAKTDSITAVYKRIGNEIRRQNLSNNAQVVLDTSGITVEFKDGLLFQPGSADGSPKFQAVVNQVMKVIANSPERYKIKIEGHTDDVPIRSPKYASNWELSASRGIYLMRQFVARGVAEDRLSVIAYAHTQPKKQITGLAGSDLEKARAANRRVIIRLESAPLP
jgi:chemotaxis protein MotB